MASVGGGGNGKPPEDPRKHSRSKMPSVLPTNNREIKYVYQLPYAILHELCRVIDCNDRWEELGGNYLKFDLPTLRELRRLGNNGLSPSDALLSRWGQRDGSLDRLFVYLAHMEFAWAMRTIQNYVSDRVRQSDRIRHLLNDGGCTTLLANFATDRRTNHSRYPDEGSITSTMSDMRYSPAKQQTQYYGNESQYSNAPTPLYRDTQPVYRTSDSSRNVRRVRNGASQFHCEPPHRVPVEGTWALANGYSTAVTTSPTPSVSNNLDRFQKEAATLQKVDTYPQSPQDDSLKIINVAAPEHLAVKPSTNGPIDGQAPERFLVDRPLPERQPIDRQSPERFAGNPQSSGRPNARLSPERFPVNRQSPERQPINGQSPERFPIHGLAAERQPFDRQSPERLPVDRHSPEGILVEKPFPERVPNRPFPERIPSDRRSPEGNVVIRPQFPQYNIHGNEDEGSGRSRRPSDPPSLACSSLPPVSYKEIVAATQAFSTKVLGRGGFGTVYRGTWKNTPVAIKQIKKQDNPGVEALDEAKIRVSLTELRISDWCRHDNILPLYSYSINEEGLCLVYQLMENGSLEDRLRCKENTPPLSWLQRCYIVRGAACGIQFLHSLERPLIHGDIKSANILLDRSMEPKLGDFGLVREGPPDEQTHMYVQYVHGTRAYLPPEYMRNRKLSTKVDTYSFGIVLFEVATGLRALDDKRPKNRKTLYDYVSEHDPHHLDQLRDKKAGEECAELFRTFMDIGKHCTRQRRARPEMVNVFHNLETQLNVQQIRNKARKGSVSDLNRADLTPMERQILHDRLHNHEEHRSRAEKSKGTFGHPKEKESTYPPPPSQKGSLPGRHATEQTVPYVHYTQETQPTYQSSSGGINSRPPTYDEAVRGDHLMNGQSPETNPQRPNHPMPKTPPSAVAPKQQIYYEQADLPRHMPPSRYSPPREMSPRIPDAHSPIMASAEMTPERPDHPLEEMSAPFLPDLTMLGVKKSAPLQNPEGADGSVQYASYTYPPGATPQEASTHGSEGAVSNVTNNNPNHHAFEPPMGPPDTGVFSQMDATVALYNSLQQLEI